MRLEVRRLESGLERKEGQLLELQVKPAHMLWQQYCIKLLVCGVAHRVWVRILAD